MIINLESLPLEIYRKIPISIKTYKKEYELSELPFEIQKLIGTINLKKEITYTDTVYDFKPLVSEYGDYTVISNLRELVIDYMTNYLKTLYGEYPFNGSVGSNVKRLLQKRDTTTQRLFLTEELNRMIRSFGSTIDKNIVIKDFSVKKNANNVQTDYDLNIIMTIDDTTMNLSTSFVL
jgi:hypothetical protein